MKKVLLAITISCIFSCVLGNVHRNQQIDYNEMNFIKVYNSKEINYDMMTSRNGNIIIERIIGKVTNNEGDGIILDTGCYISYKNVDANVGDIVLTYCIYNPDTTYIDDIIARFDYVIDTEQA